LFKSSAKTRWSPLRSFTFTHALIVKLPVRSGKLGMRT